jgi:hypothetical protein
LTIIDVKNTAVAASWGSHGFFVFRIKKGRDDSRPFLILKIYGEFDHACTGF